MKEDKKIILDMVDDLVKSFLFHNRDKNEDISDMVFYIRSNRITTDEVTARFKMALKERIISKNRDLNFSGCFDI